MSGSWVLWGLFIGIFSLSSSFEIPNPSPQTPSQSTRPMLVKAQYEWGYTGADGQGKGTLVLLLDPAHEQIVAELHGLGERLMLLKGDQKAGYEVSIPRQKLQERSERLGSLPLPYLPGSDTVSGLLHLLRTGEGPGMSIQKKDAQGPLKLHFKGKDDRGKTRQIWLSRQRWEEQPMESLLLK